MDKTNVFKGLMLAVFHITVVRPLSIVILYHMSKRQLDIKALALSPLMCILIYGGIVLVILLLMLAFLAIVEACSECSKWVISKVPAIPAPVVEQPLNDVVVDSSDQPTQTIPTTTPTQTAQTTRNNDSECKQIIDTLIAIYVFGCYGALTGTMMSIIYYNTDLTLYASGICGEVVGIVAFAVVNAVFYAIGYIVVKFVLFLATNCECVKRCVYDCADITAN